MGKKCTLGVMLMTGAVLSSGCASMNNTERGAVGGAAAGGAIGALIGSDRGHTGAGAAIGAAAGGLIGAAAGSAADADDKRIKDAQAYAAQPVQGNLRMEDIVDMVKRGISDDVIRNTIRSGNTRYNLGPSEIAWLHDNGVSDAVITEMQNTMYYRRGPRTVYIDRPDPVVVVQPAPVYRPVVGFGYGYYRVR
jgi:hypothetical protein